VGPAALGRPHLRLDGAHGRAAQLGDFLIGQAAVLPQEEDFFFLRPQIHQGDADPFQGFAVRQLVGRGDFGAGAGQRRLGQGAGAPPPGAALQVLGGVEGDAEDPRPQVANVTHAGAGPPAFQKGFLGRVLGVVVVAEPEVQGAEQLGADLVEGAHQFLDGDAAAACGRWPDRGSRCRLAHACTLHDPGTGASKRSWITVQGT
jgi:hypothetical protein